jgi:hypothetical protein
MKKPCPILALFPVYREMTAVVSVSRCGFWNAPALLEEVWNPGRWRPGGRSPFGCTGLPLECQTPKPMPQN